MHVYGHIRTTRVGRCGEAGSVCVQICVCLCLCVCVCMCVPTQDATGIFICKDRKKFGGGEDAAFLHRDLFGDGPETARGVRPLQVPKVAVEGGELLIRCVCFFVCVCVLCVCVSK